MLDTPLRYLSTLPDTLAFGLNFARYRFLTRSPHPIDPEEVWSKFAVPSPELSLLEGMHPTLLHMQAITGLNALTMRWRDHLSGIHEHYDLSNDFFGLFLDSKFRFYSSADFLDPHEALEDAQERKAQHCVALIDPKPGERILDAGSGWGGMLKHIHDVVDGKAELVGYTLSKEQQSYTREKFGLKVELKDFITADYEPGSFDKIYSIETFEHVRRRELPLFAKKMRRAIKHQGKLLAQLTWLPTVQPHPTALFIGLDLFPGSELSSLGEFVTAFERASFRVCEVKWLDYCPTVRAWFTRLGARQQEGIAMVGLRNYLRYLCYLAGLFRLFNEKLVCNARILLEAI